MIHTVLHALQDSRRPELTAQEVFMRAAHALGLKANPRTIRADFEQVSPLIKDLVRFGELSFVLNPTTGEGRYTIKNHAPINEIGVVGNHRIAGLHMKAATLLTTREWRVSRAKVAIAAEELAKGRIFVGGEWLDRTAYEIRTTDPYEEAIEDEAVSGFADIQRQQRWIIEQVKQWTMAVRFGVKCDDRGRFYVLGGMLSPHNGRFARWLYTSDDEIALDHRTSFAQMIALLTGDQELGAHVGLGNAKNGDFYVTMAGAAGIEIGRHSVEREAMKRAIMPAAYGAGEKLSRARFEMVFKAAEMEVRDDLWEVVAKNLKRFASLQAATRLWAQSFADCGETPEWRTPSNFLASKRYPVNRRVTVVFDADKRNAWWRPQTMTLNVPTSIVCTRTVKASETEAGSKSVITATMANVVQSLDAALMAHVIVKFHEKTGRVLYPIHDSYTVKKEDANILRETVCECIREIAGSTELNKLREELALPPVAVRTGDEIPKTDGRILDLRELNPLEEE